jgi:hypothetical protein
MIVRAWSSLRFRPETEDRHRAVLLPHLAEVEPALHQASLDLLLGKVLPVGRIFIDADQVVVPPGRPRRRSFRRPEGELVFRHEIHVHHIPVEGLDPRVGENPGEDRSAPELLEITAQIGHEKPHTRPVVPLLHHIEGADRDHRGEGILACNGKQSAHRHSSFHINP